MDVPESVTQKIELFRETGRVFRRRDELFAENSWVQCMMGQGIMPKSFHPIAQRMSDEELQGFLERIESRVKTTADNLPPHAAYIAQFCPAKDPI